MWFYKIAVQRAHFLLSEDFNAFALKFVYMFLESLEFSTIWSSWWDTSSVGASPCRCCCCEQRWEGGNRSISDGAPQILPSSVPSPSAFSFITHTPFLPFKKWKLYLIILMFPIVFSAEKISIFMSPRVFSFWLLCLYLVWKGFLSPLKIIKHFFPVSSIILCF